LHSRVDEARHLGTPQCRKDLCLPHLMIVPCQLLGDGEEIERRDSSRRYGGGWECHASILLGKMLWLWCESRWNEIPS
jgi:hypothetical protein